MATLGSFASGQVLTAAELNAIGTWQDYTPSFSGISVGDGTLTGRYCQINKFVAWQVELVFGSTTTVSATRVTYPVEAADAFLAGNGGQVTCEDNTGIDYFGSLFRFSTTEANVYVGKADSTYLTFSSLSSSVPFTWASGDRLIIQDFYEAA